MNDRYYLDTHKGRLCVRAESILSTGPTMHVLYWPIGSHCAADWAEHIGWALVDYGSYNGSYTLALRGEVGNTTGPEPFSWLRQVNFRLTDGAQTEAIHSEQRPIPCPGVRKGIETRWALWKYRWEKCLKSGWKPA